MRKYIITCMLFDGFRRITSGFGEVRSSSTGYDHPMFRHISSCCEMKPKNQSCIIYLEDTIPEQEPPKPPPTITLNLATAGLRCQHQPRHPRPAGYSTCSCCLYAWIYDTNTNSDLVASYIQKFRHTFRCNCWCCSCTRQIENVHNREGRDRCVLERAPATPPSFLRD